MIKGVGYLGARTRQPPTVQTQKRKISVGQGVCVLWHLETHILTVVVKVVLQ